jgi:hypothetical protein
MPKRCLSILLLALVATALTASLAEAQAACHWPCNNDREFGINIDSPTFNATRFSRAAEAGIDVVRLWAWWKWMEPQRHNIDFSSLDAQVTQAKNQGLSIMITFVSIPNWANGSPAGCNFWNGECSAPPNDPTYFREFVTAVVQRYLGRVRYYGIWNEPNLTVFWDGPFSQYISDILVNGAQAVKAADPCTKVVGPDIYDSHGRFQTVLSQACSSLDILSIHLYTSTAATLFNRITNRYDPVIQSTGCQKPLWVTEFGIDSGVSGESQQATEYTAAYSGTHDRSDVAAMFLYRIDDHEASSGPDFGLVTSLPEGFTRKPSFWAVQSYLSTIGRLCLK